MYSKNQVGGWQGLLHRPGLPTTARMCVSAPEPDTGDHRQPDLGPYLKWQAGSPLKRRNIYKEMSDPVTVRAEGRHVEGTEGKERAESFQ